MIPNPPFNHSREHQAGSGIAGPVTMNRINADLDTPIPNARTKDRHGKSMFPSDLDEKFKFAVFVILFTFWRIAP